MPSSVVRSAGSTSHAMPWRSISSAASRASASSDRATSTRSAPCAASCRANSSPMPPDAPVTSAWTQVVPAMHHHGAVEVDRRLVEEMLGSIPGESWALVGRDGMVRYSVGPRGGILGHGDRAGSHIAEFAHPDDLPAVLDGMQAVLAHPGIPVRVLSRARRADGEWRVYEVTGVNRLDDPAVEAIVVRTREVDEGGAAA